MYNIADTYWHLLLNVAHESISHESISHACFPPILFELKIMRFCNPLPILLAVSLFAFQIAEPPSGLSEDM